jgi:hypothetical protein
MRRFMVHLLTEIEFEEATKRQTRRRRTIRSISRMPFGPRRKESRFGRSRTPGSRVSR